MTKLTIPFAQHNNLKLVSAFVNGVKSTFIIDPIKQKTVLNSNYFFNKKANSEDEVYLSRITLYGLKPRGNRFKSEDLSEYEQNGRAIHGIFGQDILDGYNVDISENRLILSS